ncbi:hypothetical protein JB92DRAFT_2947475 [Gautieria morchelliformis]|nr:hypothetical protein JB92DRAFT_2947475 [Gautieria morchelliformis]
MMNAGAEVVLRGVWLIVVLCGAARYVLMASVGALKAAMSPSVREYVSVSEIRRQSRLMLERQGHGVVWVALTVARMGPRKSPRSIVKRDESSMKVASCT